MRSPARPLAQPKSIIASEAQVLVLPQPLMGPAGNFVHVDMPEAEDIWPFSLQSALFLHARYFPQDLVFPETRPSDCDRMAGVVVGVLPAGVGVKGRESGRYARKS